MEKIKGIIFDMDNTLLHSKIDFQGMKEEIFQFFVSHGILPRAFNIVTHTTSTLIKEATCANKMTDELLESMWEIPKRFEIEGMKGAPLEEGVIAVLDELKGRCRLTVLTNNAEQAAETALKDNHIYHYFDSIVGRETMGTLKPAPDGIQFIINQHKDIPAEEWISVGDSWIDGAASSEAGVTFISYKGDIEKMTRMGVVPAATIRSFSEILNLL
jgi:phosphoglycolate phosphatase